MLEKFGPDAAREFKTLNPQNAPRLAMMAEDDELAKTGRTSELLGVIGKYGDRAVNFIGRSKGTLASVAVVTRFLADPDAFIEGTKDINEMISENTLKPLAQAPGQFATEVARQTNWAVVLAAATGVVGLLVASGIWLKSRKKGAVNENPKEQSP